MEKNFNLEIISPEGEIFKGTVTELIINTVEGQITVLPSHTPLFTKLVEGEAIIKKGTEVIFIALTGGFLEIVNNKVSILADYAIKSEEITIKSAEEAKKKAEQILKQKQEGADLISAKTEFRRSLFELKIAEKVRRRSQVNR